MHLRQRSLNKVTVVVDATANQVLHRRPVAAVRHVRGVCSDGKVEHHAPEVRRGACAGGAEACGLARLHMPHEILQALARQVLARHEHQRLLGQQGHRREVGDRIEERLLVEDLVEDQIAAASEQDLIAIRRCVCHTVRARHAPCARNVLDDDLATEAFAHLLREQARDDIGRTSGPVRHDQRYRPYRPVLGASGPAGDEDSGQNDPHPIAAHSTSPMAHKCYHGGIHRAWTPREWTWTGWDSVLIVTLREVPPLKSGDGRAGRGNTTWPNLP